MNSRAICLVGEVEFAQKNKSGSVSGEKHFGLPLKHYDVFINGKCIGVTGAVDQTIHVRNMKASQFNGSHSVIKAISLAEPLSDEEIESYVRKWARDNPEYRLYDKNCQKKFANDFVKHFFDLDLTTQTNAVAFYAFILGTGKH